MHSATSLVRMHCSFNYLKKCKTCGTTALPWTYHVYSFLVCNCPSLFGKFFISLGCYH